jgi:hypothetical protein
METLLLGISSNSCPPLRKLCYGSFLAVISAD